jgi:uncharacterized protein (TIGR03086 family)
MDDGVTDAANLPVEQAHHRALDWTGQVIDGITDDQWTRPTPCEDWDVRTLANHVVAGNLWAAELARGATIDQVGSRLDGDQLVPTPAAAYHASADLAAAAFEAPGALDAPCAVSYGPIPGSVYAGHRFLDVLLHGWDLAQATDQSVAMPEDLVETCLAILEPQIDGFVAAGAFAAAPALPADVTPSVRLLTLAGRSASS